MRKGLYLRLAATNLWKSRQTYIPYLGAAALLAFTLYTFSTIAQNPGLAHMPGAAAFTVLLMLGQVVLAIFAAIFLFYANSFLIKRRKKELGLYGILGLEKRQVARVMFYESFFSYLISLGLGLGLGALLGRLMFLVVQSLMRVPIPLENLVSFPSMAVTAVLMGASFFAALLYNLIQVGRASPVELLRGGQQGEREPKARWLLALVGFVTLAGGYYLAQWVQNPMTAIAFFFVAVLLVIAGTYLLFTTGSIAVLKLMKKNKGYYYRPRHFVAVSGMLYRMKQNAAGLASICILATMAMVTVGTTSALYIGGEDMLRQIYPWDCSFGVAEGEEARGMALARELAQERGLAAGPMLTYRELLTHVELNGYHMSRNRTNMLEGGVTGRVTLIPLSDYNAFSGEERRLAPRQVLAYNIGDLPLGDAFTVNGQTYEVTHLDALAIENRRRDNISNTCYLILADKAAAEALETALYGEQADLVWKQRVVWNFTGPQAAREDYALAMWEGLGDLYGSRSYSFVDLQRSDWYATYGGFLFIGVFLGLVFLLAAALIIYFKQVTEGYQDHDRFVILQKVGMDAQEVKATVRKQILMIFFLPLGVALCHVGGALNMVANMLAAFGLVNVRVIAWCTFGCALGVGLIYAFIYLRTARTYYRLVRF